MIYDSALEAVLRQDREMNRLRAIYDSSSSIANRIALGLVPDHGGLGLSITSAELARVLADPLADQKHLLANTASGILMEMDRQAQQKELAESLIHQRAIDAVRHAIYPATDYLHRNEELARMAAGLDHHEHLRRIATGRYGDSASAWVESGLWQPPSQSLLGGLDDARLAAINATIEPWRHRPGYAESFSALALASDAMSANDGGLGSYRPLIGDIQRIAYGPEFESSAKARVRAYLDAGYDSTLTKPNQNALIGMLGINGFIEPGLWEYKGRIIVPTRREGMEAHLKELKPKKLEAKAYKEVGAFECWLRIFIDEEMSLTYGDDWFMTYAPKSLLKRVQKKTLDGEEITGLIVLRDADFAHYLEIILHDDHWPDVFSYILGDRTEAETILNHLKSLRASIAHFKGVSKEDMVQLRVCVRWFKEKMSAADA